ncbi:pectin lyase fold/virulence factor [Powellomyces hirtus]|nr:pectin lyase fold/virulence factor [Powellomyces hirtus]
MPATTETPTESTIATPNSLEVSIGNALGLAAATLAVATTETSTISIVSIGKSTTATPTTLVVPIGNAPGSAAATRTSSSTAKPTTSVVPIGNAPGSAAATRTSSTTATPTTLVVPIGKAPGFAAGTTGGGTVEPIYPTDIKHLKSLLSDAFPRVIYLNRTFDFTNSEGKKTEVGCRPTSNTCPGKGGQDAINTSGNWCGTQPPINVTYDVAGQSGMSVKNNKTLRGLGDRGVLYGKGLVITGSNVIIQNIHITNLNPQYIWGGDGIHTYNNDRVWIDHVKVSRVGRQMIVSNYEGSRSLTVSNSEFDGRTPWSASCNGCHYWAMMFIGAGDKITFWNNYVHDTSGRSPKSGGSAYGNVLLHAVNNYFENIKGHAFDVSTGSSVLIEANYFLNVATPKYADATSRAFVPTATSLFACGTTPLRRKCIVNTLATSGALENQPGTNDTTVMTLFPNDVLTGITSANKARQVVLAGSGFGKM